jgi:hypothetical protein
MRHYATSWKAAGLIADEVTVFFNIPNHYICIMSVRWTQPLTEMSTRKLPWGEKRPAHKAENLDVICERIVQKVWDPRRLTTLCASTACYKDSLYSYFFWLTLFKIYFFLF